MNFDKQLDSFHSNKSKKLCQIIQLIAAADKNSVLL
jgi:hypothetical protein